MNNCINAIAKFDSKNVKGFIKFHQCFNQNGTHISINLYDLEPDKKRAIHVHEFGDERQGCKSLGGHWNPSNNSHGSIYLETPRHAGDLINNLSPDSKGIFNLQYYDPLINLYGNIEQSIIGRSVVIHAGVDDLGLGGLNNQGEIVNYKVHEDSLKTGNAGSRMACAIIGISGNDN